MATGSVRSIVCGVGTSIGSQMADNSICELGDGDSFLFW